jgi:hypothetical protein
MVLATGSVAASTIKFGANLTSTTFPSNAYPGTYCDHEINGTNNTYGCTWILNQAYNGGAVAAPHAGSVSKVKIINGQAGSFKLVIARKNASGQFKVLRKSYKIYYSTDPCDIDCTIHTYTVSPSLLVSLGDYVGIQTNKTSTLRCDSGGSRTALFTPTLAAGGSYTTPTDYSGCFLLIQPVITY